jgi:hypothetical protein
MISAVSEELTGKWTVCDDFIILFLENKSRERANFEHIPGEPQNYILFLFIHQMEKVSFMQSILLVQINST